MNIGDIYNSLGDGVNKVTRPISSFFQPLKYTKEQSQEYNIPPVIAKEHVPTFIEQAKLAGVTPDEFGLIARREQGSSTLPHQAAVVGLVDPTDKGVMQVNKMHDKLIQQRFKNELGRNYNPRDPVDSIIAARMILEENRRQFEQMKLNKTFNEQYSNRDLIDTYNTGVRGWIEARAGNKDRQKRLERYQQAGKEI